MITKFLQFINETQDDESTDKGYSTPFNVNDDDTSMQTLYPTSQVNGVLVKGKLKMKKNKKYIDKTEIYKKKFI